MLLGNRTVTVNRLVLLEKLKENAEKHRKDYKEAVDSYVYVATNKLKEERENAEVKLREKYESLIGELNAGKTFNVVTLLDEVIFELPNPQNHIKDYQLAIDMTEMDVNENITLTQREFQAYIQDKWDWKYDFDNTTSFYKQATIGMAAAAPRR